MKRDGIYERQVKMMGESGVKNQARISQAMINIATKKFKAGDKELESAYNTMKTRYVHGPRKYIALLINPDKSKIEEAQKALKDGESFDTVVTKFTDSRMAMMGGPIETWVDDTQPGLPPQLTSAIKDTKKGEVSEMFELSQPKSPTQYCLLKVKDTQGKTDIKLKEVKDEVAGLVAMQKAQGDPSFQKELTKRKKDAKIKVNITGFESVAEAVKNPPQQPPMTMGR
ncbi:MAG: peptidyl-prolyl cis-trans isomerase [Armatimonadota bacterium]